MEICANRSNRATLLFIAVALAISGCESKTKPPVEAQPETAAQEPDTGFTESDRVALMEHHYDAVIKAHDAVIAGDHEAARTALTGLAGQDLPAKAPASWRPPHKAMQAVAGRTAAIEDVDSAAAAVASAVQACGSCHSQLGRVPLADHKPPTPQSGEELDDKMKTHQWATERLWEGVAGPSDQAWQRGAAVLAASPAFAKGGVEITEELGKQAAALRAPRRRCR